MRGKKLLATLAISAVLFAGCGLKSGEAIIKVNNQNITQGQFDAEFNKQAGNGIAKALGISRQTINAIESGKYNPTIKLL